MLLELNASYGTFLVQCSSNFLTSSPNQLLLHENAATATIGAQASRSMSSRFPCCPTLGIGLTACISSRLEAGLIIKPVPLIARLRKSDATEMTMARCSVRIMLQQSARLLQAKFEQGYYHHHRSLAYGMYTIGKRWQFYYLAAALSQCPTFLTPTLSPSLKTWTFEISIESAPLPQLWVPRDLLLAISLLPTYVNDNAVRQPADEDLCENMFVLFVRA